MRFKVWGIVILAGVVLFVLLQNTQVVSVRFLFWRLSMSQVILLPLILVIGLAAGFIIGRLYRDQ